MNKKIHFYTARKWIFYQYKLISRQNIHTNCRMNCNPIVCEKTLLVWPKPMTPEQVLAAEEFTQCSKRQALNLYNNLQLITELNEDLDVIKNTVKTYSTPNYPKEFNHKFNGVYDFYNGYPHYRSDLHEEIIREKIRELEMDPAKILENRVDQFESLKSLYEENEFYDLYDVEKMLNEIRLLEKKVDELNKSI